MPKTATREQLEAVIARSWLHMTKPEPDKSVGCFGYFAKDDMNCKFCDYRGECAKAAFGVTEKRQARFESSIENPRVRFAEPIRKGRR